MRLRPEYGEPIGADLGALIRAAVKECSHCRSKSPRDRPSSVFFRWDHPLRSHSTVLDPFVTGCIARSTGFRGKVPRVGFESNFWERVRFLRMQRERRQSRNEARVTARIGYAPESTVPG